jgi:hypothetical protein
MAQAKARASSGRSKTSKTAKRKSPAKPKATKSRQPSPAKASSERSKNGVAQVDSARKAVKGTAGRASHSAGEAAHSLGRVASKAKTPLLAGGAAAVGVAGGIALGARQASHGKTLSRRPKVKIGPKVKIDSHDLAKAAKEVGQLGMDVGQLAAELRRNRESAHANGTKRPSPLEVVLQGLTSRGNGS